MNNVKINKQPSLCNTLFLITIQTIWVFLSGVFLIFHIMHEDIELLENSVELKDKFF